MLACSQLRFLVPLLVESAGRHIRPVEILDPEDWEDAAEKGGEEVWIVLAAGCIGCKPVLDLICERIIKGPCHPRIKAGYSASALPDDLMTEGRVIDDKIPLLKVAIGHSCKMHQLPLERFQLKPDAYQNKISKNTIAVYVPPNMSSKWATKSIPSIEIAKLRDSGQISIRIDWPVFTRQKWLKINNSHRPLGKKIADKATISDKVQDYFN